MLGGLESGPAVARAGGRCCCLEAQPGLLWCHSSGSAGCVLVLLCSTTPRAPQLDNQGLEQVLQ